MYVCTMQYELFFHTRIMYVCMYVCMHAIYRYVEIIFRQEAYINMVKMIFKQTFLKKLLKE
jgi:hypothetical protein